MRTFIKKNPLLSFVILNYIFSWIFLYPCYQTILQAEDGTFPWIALLGLPGAYGPGITAIFIVWLTEGKESLRKMLKKLLLWKVHWRWYLFIFIVPIFFYLLAVLFSGIVGYGFGQPAYAEGIKMMFLYILLALPFGPMGEELGWRGYMLPRLLERFNPVKSSLILGVVWTFWHLASFTFPGAAIPSVFPVTVGTVALFLCYLVMETFIFTYVWFKTNGSVFIAILLHAVFNASSNIVLTFLRGIEDNVEQRYVIYISSFVFLGILAFILFYRNHYFLSKTAPVAHRV